MTGRLKAKRFVSDSTVLLEFDCPEIAAAARPGQFVEIQVSETPYPLYRRPFSFFDADGDAFSILFKIAGTGTQMISCWEPDYVADFIGPLGNGFSWKVSDEKAILVGGGIGVSPLNFLARKLIKEGKRVSLLYAPKRDSALLNELTCDGAEVFCAENRKQTQEELRDMLSLCEQPVNVYTCGPDGFMKFVVDNAAEFGLCSYASLETRMACGFGICMVCAARIRVGDEIKHMRVCSDGPVFSGTEVVFE